MLPTLEMSVRYRRTSRQVYRLIAGEHLLVDMHAKSDVPFYALTASGALLWQALEEGRTEDELASVLRARYDVPMDRVLADVREFLEQLEALGAVEREAGA